MSVDGINAITSNPYMNGLGTIGLGGISSFGNYGDPMMSGMMMGAGTMGLNGMSGMTSPYSMGMMGGMMNPAFMAQMYKSQAQTQQEIEKMQLEHTGAMNQLLQQSETQALSNNDRAIFEKAMVDADIQNGLRNLIDKVNKGDTNNVVVEFNKLRNTLYTKYADYFNSNKSKMSVSKSATQFIEMMYANVMTAQTGRPASLRSDIERICDNSFQKGFWRNIKGKDYHSKDAEETLSEIFNMEVDNPTGKKRMEKAGKWTESILEGAASPFVGYAAGGIAGLTAGGILKSLFATVGKGKWIPMFKIGKFAAGAGMLLAPLADIAWQMTRN